MHSVAKISIVNVITYSCHYPSHSTNQHLFEATEYKNVMTQARKASLSDPPQSSNIQNNNTMLYCHSQTSTLYRCLSIYIKRLGMFPFKVQLFQGCKSETEPINTKSVVQHVIRYHVLLAEYYKADTKYCCCCATCLSGHIVDFTTHTSTICIRYQALLVAYYEVFWT
jgi:uncharacterized surface protein with fasciclin (FAS1) repeats